MQAFNGLKGELSGDVLYLLCDVDYLCTYATAR